MGKSLGLQMAKASPDDIAGAFDLAAIVDAIGPIRQIVRAGTPVERRYLVIAAGTPAQLGPVVQTQVD